MDRIKSFNQLLELAREEQPPQVDLSAQILSSIEDAKDEQDDNVIKMWFAAITSVAAAVAVIVALSIGSTTTGTDVSNLFTDIDPSYGLSVLWGA